jgi:hypothetical protein
MLSTESVHATETSLMGQTEELVGLVNSLTHANGHAAAEPQITLMNSRRLIASSEAQDRAWYQPAVVL